MSGASAASMTATTATPATRLLGIAAIVGLAALVLFGLVLTPADRSQGESVRMLYLHAPTAWVAYLAFAVTALASALYDGAISTIATCTAPEKVGPGGLKDTVAVRPGSCPAGSPSRGGKAARRASSATATPR